MRLLSFLGAAAVVVTLASCNSMSKDECRVADWRVIGDTDGAAGHNPQERFADHVKSCSSIGVKPNQTVWYEGYQAGVKRYCTPLSGATHGEAGNGYYNACPPELEGEFMRGYGLGKRVHELRRRLESIQSNVRFREMEMDRRYKEMKDAKEENRRGIRNQIDDLDRDIRRAKREGDDVRYELEGAIGDLNAFRQVMSVPANAKIRG